MELIHFKNTAQLSPSVERVSTYGTGESSIYRVSTGGWGLILRKC
jgi:hypothetical protein